MNDRNGVIRMADTLSLATWFGGSLMGAVGLHRARQAADDDPRVEGAGWSAWQPVQGAAIAAQLASSAALTVANRHRLVGQRGVGTLSLVRTGLTGAALVATALAARSGREVEHRQRGDATGSAAGSAGGSAGGEGLADVAAGPGPTAAAGAALGSTGGDRPASGNGHRATDGLQTRTRALQWAVPALTGALLAMDALMGEQQRPKQMAEGVVARILPDAIGERLAA